MISLESKEHLKAILSNTNVSGVVLYFSASWCEPCGPLKAHLNDVRAPQHKDTVMIVEVDVEKFGDVCEELNVDSVPHLVFYRTSASSGALDRVAEVSGAKMAEIEQNFFSLFGKGREDKSAHATLDDYLKYLITKDRRMLFITGTPSRPMCGFTGRLMELLRKHEVSFSYYDIMTDNEVCERLKTFSNWPTYPQVYVDGELIGGFDIMMELEKSGELREALKL